jgi:voltage-gated potassium channel
MKRKYPKNPFLWKVFRFIGILLFVMLVGVIGYMSIENWSFLDALYMTVITTSTVGFSEVNGLSPDGKYFTILLILSSFGTVAFAISSLTNSVIGGEYKKYLKDLKLYNKLARMENHVIVSGFGRVGKQVVQDLLACDISVVIIDNNEISDENLKNNPKIAYLQGDATNEDTLCSANIDKADFLITCLPKDTDNVYVVLTAKELNKKLNIIARATQQQAVSKLKSAGATHVVMPDAIGGSHMATIVASPDVIEFMDSIRAEGTEGVNVEAISFNEIPSEFKFKKIKHLETKTQTGVTIIGFKTPKGEYIINPDCEIEIVPNSKLFVLGNSKQIADLNKLLDLQ